MIIVYRFLSCLFILLPLLGASRPKGDVCRGSTRRTPSSKLLTRDQIGRFGRELNAELYRSLRSEVKDNGEDDDDYVGEYSILYEQPWGV
jgi:hypothetical protein